MQVSKEAILSKTHYGLKIYSRILTEYYPGKTVLSLRGRNCDPAPNPFNHDKPTLKIQVKDNCACHTDLEGALPDGDVFGFASHYFGLEGQDLLDRLDSLMGLRIADPIRRCPFPLPPVPVPREPGMEQTYFSYFKAPIRNVLPEFSVTPFMVYTLIRSGVFKNITEELRAITDPKVSRNFKASRFNYVTFSGRFHKRSDTALIQHSGLMVIDFDHLPDPGAMRQRLLADEYFETVLLFTSPSGDGLKWVIPVDLLKTPHHLMFAAIAAYVKSVYGVEVDPSGKDVSRACFLPYDPNVYLNPKYY